jgi:hypothetical protein
MANDTKRISELSVVTSLSANDRLVVLTNPTTAAQTQTIALKNLVINAMSYANTTAAGVVKVGNNLTINATGYLTLANSISTSIIATTTNTYSLGNSSSSWQATYLSDGTSNAGIIFTTNSAIQSANTGTIRITSGSKVWSFDINGNTILPTPTTVPQHSYGSSTDTVGMVAFDGNYIYYCKQTYSGINPTADIWVRVAWTDTTW